MRVLFAPASGPGVGGGHVLRGLSLAAELSRRGVRCAFAANRGGLALVDRFAREPVERLEATSRDALRGAVETFQPDVLCVDNYALDAGDEGVLREGVARLLVIDDLANRPHVADVLLDPGYGRTASDYAGLADAGTTLLLGPAYALLRPEFAVAEPRRTHDAEIGRVFVSFGLSDVGGVTARAVRLVREALPQAQIDVALGSSAQSREALEALARRETRLTVHVDHADPIALMQRANIAVGAGGSATWERCRLGLPTLAVVVADNQRPAIAGLARDRVLLSVALESPSFDADFGQALDALASPALRARLSDASVRVCDGQGAVRTADALLSGVSVARGYSA